MEKLSYKHSTITSLLWSVLGKLAPQVLTPLITIYIARLLSPEIYGLVAIATIVISFVEIFMASGFFTALIQKKGGKSDIYQSANFVFSLNLIFSFFLYGIIFFSAGSITSFFNEPEAKNIIKVLAIIIIIGAFGKTQYSLFQKTMDFRSIFFIQIIPVFSLLIVVLPLVQLGYGVWALVAGQIISKIIASIIFWIKSEWKPKLNFKFSENKDILHFGFWVIIEALLAWALIQGDGLIVGKFLSVKELGLYRTGFNFDNKLLGFVVIPIIPVFYAKFCSLKDADAIKRYYMRLKEYIGLFIFPIIFGIILISPYFEHLILNDRWEGIGFVMAALTVTGVSYLWALMGNMFKALGKPKIPVIITLIVVVIDIPLWLFFIKYGLHVFLIARMFIELIAFSINTYFENKVLNISLLLALNFYYKALIAALIMFFIGTIVQYYILDNQYNVYSLFFLILISILTYLIAIRLIKKEYFIIIKEMIFDKFMNKTKNLNQN
jgi:O-antigen/teichoic acid export membrane protein